MRIEHYYPRTRVLAAPPVSYIQENRLTFKTKVRLTLKLDATCFYFPIVVYASNYSFARRAWVKSIITRAPECLQLRRCLTFRKID